MPELPEPLPACPSCGDPYTRVIEDVTDDVIVLACAACDTSWAIRRD